MSNPSIPKRVAQKVPRHTPPARAAALTAATAVAAVLAAVVLAACGGGSRGGSNGGSNGDQISGSGPLELPATSSGGRPRAVSEPSGATAQITGLFTDLDTTLAALMGSDGGAKTQAQQFSDAVVRARVPAEFVVKDGAVLLMGAQLFNDFMHGRGANQRGGMPAQAGDLPQRDQACGLYASPTAATAWPTRLATPADGANVQLWCATVFWRDDVARQAVGHVFKLTPAMGADGNVASLAVAAQRAAWTGERADSPDAQAASRNVQVSVGFNSQGNLARFALQGELPPHFQFQTGDPVNAGGYSRLAMSGTVAAANGQQQLTLQGADGTPADTTLTVFAAGAAQPESTLVLKSGSAVALSSPANAAWEPAGLRLSWVWTSADSRLVGRANLSDYTADKSGTRRLPATLTFDCTLGSLGSGAYVDFLGGKLATALSGVGAWDGTQPRSAQNDFDIDAQFSGGILASGKVITEIEWHTQGRSGAAAWEKLDGELRLMNGTAARRIYDLQATADNGGSVTTLSVQEKLTAISFTMQASDRGIPILKDGATVVGTLERDGKPPGAHLADGTVMPLGWL